MRYSTLGNTGLSVSRICLGTMTWGRQNTEAEGHEQMDYATTNGVNFFDTAEMYAVPPTPDTYGKTEQIIGTWFASRKNRDKIILATKIAGSGMAWVRDGKSKIDRANILQAVEGSLNRLQTDYIDLYQLHWPNRPYPHFRNHWGGAVDFTTQTTAEIEDNFLDVLQTLTELVRAGKIRHAGLSNETPWGVMAYNRIATQNGLTPMVSMQNEYSLLNRVDEPWMAETCIRDNIAYLSWSPLAGGFISGKYANGARPAGSRWSLDTRPLHRDSDNAHKAVTEYHAVAKKHGLDPCQMALKFCDMQPFVTSTIIGATSMDQLKSNMNAFDLDLSHDALADIDRVYRNYPIPY